MPAGACAYQRIRAHAEHTQITAAASDVVAVEGIGYTGTVATSPATIRQPPPGSSPPPSTGATAAPPSPGTITTADSGVFAVIGSHIYAEEEGSYPTRITITDSHAQAVSVSGTATVQDAPCRPPATRRCCRSNPVTDLPVAVFSDVNPGGPVTDFTATTDWSDATSTTAGRILDWDVATGWAP